MCNSIISKAAVSSNFVNYINCYEQREKTTYTYSILFFYHSPNIVKKVDIKKRGYTCKRNCYSIFFK